MVLGSGSSKECGRTRAFSTTKAVQLVFRLYRETPPERVLLFGMRRAGFVLTGGQSTRMGRDKALLPWGGSELVREVASTVAEAAGTVTLVGRPESYRHLGIRCIADERLGLGPLSGLHSALAAGLAEYSLIVACDMPNLHLELLTSLLQVAESSQADCVVAEDSAGYRHPLCAVYRSTALPTIERAMNNGDLRLLQLVASLRTLAFKYPGPVLNCNTPEEWAALQ